VPNSELHIKLINKVLVIVRITTKNVQELLL